jgi:hypothetical protein
MGFIKHAIIGIVLYEAVKCILKKEGLGFACGGEGTQPGSTSELATGHGISSRDLGDALRTGTNPEAPLHGHDPAREQNDPWKNSLANDDLRAPDS